ncbi:MAG: CHAD domain-containing protein [Caldimonas sp.]
MSETELKFALDPARAGAVRASLRGAKARARLIESSYFDTPDSRLAAAGLSLRLRRTGRAWAQTLKAPGAGAVDRLEDTVARPGRFSRVGPVVDAALHHGTDAGAQLERALSADRGAPAPLVLRFRTIVRRVALELCTPEARVELAFDRGEIVAGDATAPLCELEYELKSGSARALIGFGEAGVAAHGLCLDTASKSARGERLARGDAFGEPVKASPPALRAGMAGPALLRAALGACFDQVGANASEVSRGDRSDERVHQLRVGLRRLRTVARELGHLQAALDPGWQASIDNASRALGRFRDRTTVLATMQSRLAAAGAPEPELQPAAPDADDPVAVVRDAAFQGALLHVLRAVIAEGRVAGDSNHSNDVDGEGGETGREQASDPSSTGAQEAQRLIRLRLSALRRKVRRGARRFEQVDAEAQHRVRKQVKRLRYLSEIVAGLFDGDDVDRFLAKLRPAQDALGAHVDLLVAEGLARTAAEGGDARAWFSVGWLAAQLPSSARACRRALKRAAAAKRFW